jgi:hypothetical protein
VGSKNYRTNLDEKLKKTLDSFKWLWYNIDNEREVDPNEKGNV